MDEASKQLISETRLIIPARPGQLETFDHEYAREGVCNLFMFCEPLAGRRHVRMTTRRTRLDWAHAVREMVDVWYPDAELIRLVMDNLNTHSLASLYEAFDPEEAQRIRKRLEIHHGRRPHQAPPVVSRAATVASRPAARHDFTPVKNGWGLVRAMEMNSPGQV